MEYWHYLIALGGAIIAGIINSIAGGGTLISFPTLIWIGLDPIQANATNTVALWPGSLAGALGFRREMSGSGRWIAWLAGPSIAGGLAGAVLLLRTPSRIFGDMVPFLIIFATLLFAIQGRLIRFAGARASNPSARWMAGAAIFQFAVAVYGGYFGAGIGILMLAALGILGLEDIHQMNGLKNLFAFVINGVAAFYFIVAGSIDWSFALVMAMGAVIGGYAGAGLARRIGRSTVRGIVVVVGAAVALLMLL